MVGGLSWWRDSPAIGQPRKSEYFLPITQQRFRSHDVVRCGCRRTVPRESATWLDFFRWVELSAGGFRVGMRFLAPRYALGLPFRFESGEPMDAVSVYTN
jgi:hypothetical protein